MKQMKQYKCTTSKLNKKEEVILSAKNMQEASIRMAIWVCIQRKIGQGSKIYVNVTTVNNTSKWYLVNVKDMTTLLKK